MTHLAACVAHPATVAAAVLALGVAAVAAGSAHAAPPGAAPTEASSDASAAAPTGSTAAGPAREDAPAADGLRWLAGGRLVLEPTYAGSGRMHVKPVPLWAVRWGRWRLGTGGVGGLLASAADAGSGASFDLVNRPGWAMSAALRVDSGRPSSDDPALSGLADVRQTVRLRVASRWAWPAGLETDAFLSQDVLNRGGGLELGLGLGRRGRLTPQTTWSAGVHLSWADATYQRGRYGVPLSAQAAGRPAYLPGAGLHAAGMGVTTTTELSRRWALLTSASVSRLLGPAADSPLTQRSTGGTVSVGLVWRSEP